MRSVRWMTRVVVAALAVVVGAERSSAQCQGRWLQGPQFPFQEPGANDQIYSSTLWDPDGTGYMHPRLVVGGLFTSIGGTAANRVAYWDGSNWYPLGQGSSGQGFNNLVYAVKEFNGELYAAGAFTAANGVAINHVAKYNTTTHAWVQVGTGFDGDVRALEIHQNELYAGGFFTLAGATTVNHVARLSGSTWVALSGGGTSGPVYALSSGAGIGGPNLYVGGQFVTAGVGGSAVTAHNIARWSSTAIWNSCGQGTDGIVTSLSGGAAAVGGVFNNVFSGTGQQIASRAFAVFLSPTSTAGVWLSGVNYPGTQVYGIGTDGSHTYACGLGGTNLCYRFDNPGWTPMGSGYTGSFVGNTLVQFEGEMVMGGLFPNMITGPGLHNLARLHDGQWTNLSPRVNSPVNCFLNRGVLSAGGAMEQSTDDYQSLAGMINWNGSAFSTQGNVRGTVNSMISVGNGISLPTLVVAGNFASAGSNGGTYNNIASWSGLIGSGGVDANWATLGTGFTQGGSGPTATVYSLTTFGTQGVGRVGIIHAGGHFDNAGGNAANNIAKYVGGVWQALGGGVTSGDGTARVNAMVVFSSALFAAGSFDAAGGLTANSIARWDGTAWSALAGGGVLEGGARGTVNALAIFNNQLVVGGRFTTAGGVSTNSVASYDGAWHNMSAGIPASEDQITALAVYDGQLFAATYTSLTPTTFQGRLYRWTGASWSLVGTGDGQVNALAVFSNALHVGGAFKHFAGQDNQYWVQMSCYCVADVDDGSGTGTPDNGVTIDDLLFYLNLFNSGDIRADVDDGSGLNHPDGGVTIDDLLYYLQRFNAGC